MLLKIMFCICRSSDGISLRMESASEDQQYVLHTEATRLYAEVDDQNLHLNKYTLTLIKDIFTKSSTL